MIGDDKMDINMEELVTYRQQLESEYDKLEKEISKLYAESDLKHAQEKENIQNLVDEQLDLIDLIISNLENTPKMYKELLKIEDQYKKIVGE